MEAQFPQPTPSRRPGPGKFWYAIAAALIVAGIGIGVVPALLMILNRPRTVSMVGPGSKEIQVTQPATYILWHDYETVVDGHVYTGSNALPDGLQVVLVHKQSGASVPLETDRSIAMSSGQLKRQSVGRFHLPAPGLYQLTIGGQNLKPTVFSFGNDWLIKFLAKAFAVGIAGMALAIAGVFLGVMIFSKRRGNS